MAGEHFTQAWRNLWRNRRRSLITIGALAFTVALLVLTGSLSEGMVRGMIRSATETSMGLVEAHAPGYRSEHSFYNSIADDRPIMEAADRLGIAVTRRSYGFGLAAFGEKSAGAQVWGVDPAAERKAFRFPQKLVEGEFPGDAAEGKVVLGRKLARILKAGVGDDIVLVVQAADGSMGNELLRVSGIFAFIGDDFDRSAAVVHADDFERLFVSEGRIHELAFIAHDGRTAEEMAAQLAPFAGPLEMKTWRELAPPLSDMDLMMRGMMAFMALVFSLAAGFGVVNTMAMAVHERVREYGVLKALGATPMRLFTDTSIEALLMGCLGSALGGVLGVLLSWWFHVHPIDLSGALGDISFVGVAFDTKWQADFSPDVLFINGVIMIVLSWAVSILPAFRAARLNAVEAINHDG